MIVKNLTRKTIISNDLKIASSLLDRLLGLLNSQNPRSLLFNTRFGIHTFGLDKPIDVIVIDQRSKIRILKTIKPNSLFFYNPKYKTVIELSKGAIKKSKTQIGDKIAILNN